MGSTSGRGVYHATSPDNTRNLCEVFGCRSGGEYEDDPSRRPPVLEACFWGHGCEFVRRAAYDVRSWFLDIESFIFWLKAVPFSEDFGIERHWQEVERVLERISTPRGVEMNKQGSLLITEKRWRRSHAAQRSPLPCAAAKVMPQDRM